mmetsp:Transcript_18814/g.36918  ORF Transcript_18814/g.36918 Transcript_18814/m.36918 type:complete len:90 (+) Transcript_18814:375-644(+)
MRRNKGKTQLQQLQVTCDPLPVRKVGMLQPSFVFMFGPKGFKYLRTHARRPTSTWPSSPPAWLPACKIDDALRLARCVAEQGQMLQLPE